MTIHRAEDLAPQIRALFVLGSLSGMTDGQLLDRFATGDPQASALAFETLVKRHGSMVLRVARGVLRDPHDAQDAFQATFLVLVRKARSIRDRESLASWLHGVALRVANHARADRARRRRHERIKAERAGSPASVEAPDDYGPSLHREVGRLPERYRAAVVLCYLEGHTCEDAARLLQWPVGTVKSRLARARERLRRRLSNPGLTPALALELRISSRAIAPVSHRLAKETAEAAARFGASSTAPPSASGAFVLAKGVLKMMTLAKLKLPALALLAVASWLGGSSALSTPELAQAPPKDPTPPIAVDEPVPPPRGQVVHERDRRGPPVAVVEPGPPLQPPESPMIAPRDLTTTAGKGAALMYVLNDRGERSIERPAQEPELAGDEPKLEVRYKETNTDLRWVAIAGVLDHWLILERGKKVQGLVGPAFQPNYKRADVERQVRKPDGDWSDWTQFDMNKNYAILDNLPEIAFERTPEEVRPIALVDPLPVLKKGAWSGVDPEVLLKLPTVRPPFGGGVPANAPEGNKIPKPLPPVLMVRSLDFTVEPGNTYRYRVRIVVANPEAGQKGRKKELFGPWSGPTKEVVVP